MGALAVSQSSLRPSPSDTTARLESGLKCASVTAASNVVTVPSPR